MIAIAIAIAPNSTIISTKTKSLIFNARMRMLPVKTNFKSSYKDLNCRFGCNRIENEEHLSECKEINAEDKVDMTKLVSGNLLQMKIEAEKMSKILQKFEDLNSKLEKVHRSNINKKGNLKKNQKRKAESITPEDPINPKKIKPEPKMNLKDTKTEDVKTESESKSSNTESSPNTENENTEYINNQAKDS